MASFSLWHWLIVALLVMCAVTPLVAYWKNRPVLLWFALGVLLKPGRLCRPAVSAEAGAPALCAVGRRRRAAHHRVRRNTTFSPA